MKKKKKSARDIDQKMTTIIKKMQTYACANKS